MKRLNRFLSVVPLDIASLVGHRRLLWRLVKRDVMGRYRGSALGLTWSLATPLVMLGIYTFVFSVVFEMRWGTGTNRFQYATTLFAGLIVFNLFSESLNRAPSLILEQPAYVKKVVFPLEILPVMAVGTALFHALASLAVWFIFYGAAYRTIPWTALFLPLIWVPYLLLIMGFSWFLASLGVFLRDISHLITSVTAALLFICPVFYPLSLVPKAYRPWLYLNPVTTAVEETRRVLLQGNFPRWDVLGFGWILAVVAAGLGLAWFHKTRKGFADVL